jgi:virginiamycin B lyase
MASLTLAIAALCVGCQAAKVGSQAEPRPNTSPENLDRTITLPGNSYPNGMAFAKDGTLWVAEESVSAIARIDEDGHIKQYPIPGGPNDPDGIIQGPDGEMWFVGLEIIGRVDVSGRMTGWRTGNNLGADSVGLPESITTGPDGLVWYVNGTGPNSSISRVGPGRPPSIVATFPEGDYIFPRGGIATGPDNAVWFSLINGSYGSDKIARVSMDGHVSSWPLPPGSVPQNLVTAVDGAVWFTENSGIGRITTAGELTHFPIAGGERPTDIISTSDGSLWFTTATRIGRITMQGRSSLWPVPGSQSLNAIVAEPRGGFWVSDNKLDIVRHFAPPG